MSDLSIVIMSMCAQLKNPIVNVGKYTVTLDNQYGRNHCTCPAFKFRKNRKAECKHIKHALTNRCTWHEQIDGPQNEPGVCPNCKGPTVYVQVGV